ncbi:hypothetical protein Tco_0863189 [Tanacetum coccineum]
MNKLVKQNKVLGLPSLIYSKDKPCLTCEKGKHHKASFKTKQNFSIKKCMHLLHMDLLGPVNPMSINHEKYTLVIVDEYSRQYQENYDISYYITPHNRSLTELIKDTQVPEVITPNEQNLPHTEDVKGLPNQINTEETQEQTVHNEQINYQPSEEPSRNNTRTSVPITKLSVPKVTQSQITHHASTSSHHAPLDRWSRDQHIELMNIIGEPTKGMLTRRMAAKLTAASASECLFADFLSKSEPKKVSEALKPPEWVDAMQEELNNFYRNKVWTLVHSL